MQPQPRRPVGSLWPGPRGRWQAGCGRSGQAPWLDGSGFQSPPTDSRTLARTPEPWFFHLGRARFLPWNEITGLCDKEPPHTHAAGAPRCSPQRVLRAITASTPLVHPPSAPTAQRPGGASSYSIRVWKDPQTCNSTASVQPRPLDLDSLCSCLNFVKMRKKL